MALASCRAVTEGTAELGVLVEDGWQRHGIGLRLLDALVTQARRQGFRTLEAQVLAGQPWIAGVMRRYGTCLVTPGSDGIQHVTLRLR